MNQKTALRLFCITDEVSRTVQALGFSGWRKLDSEELGFGGLGWGALQAIEP